MVKPYSVRKVPVRNALLPATLPKWHRIVIFGLFCHFSVKQIFTFPTHFEGRSGSFSKPFLAFSELIELFAILQCFPHDLFDLIISAFPGLLVYIGHSSSLMIETDSGSVFHIHFPRSFSWFWAVFASDPENGRIVNVEYDHKYESFFVENLFYQTLWDIHSAIHFNAHAILGLISYLFCISACAIFFVSTGHNSIPEFGQTPRF